MYNNLPLPGQHSLSLWFTLKRYAVNTTSQGSNPKKSIFSFKGKPSNSYCQHHRTLATLSKLLCPHRGNIFLDMTLSSVSPDLFDI